MITAVCMVAFDYNQPCNEKNHVDPSGIMAHRHDPHGNDCVVECISHVGLVWACNVHFN